MTFVLIVNIECVSNESSVCVNLDTMSNMMKLQINEQKLRMHIMHPYMLTRAFERCFNIAKPS